MGGSPQKRSDLSVTSTVVEHKNKRKTTSGSDIPYQKYSIIRTQNNCFILKLLLHIYQFPLVSEISMPSSALHSIFSALICFSCKYFTLLQRQTRNRLQRNFTSITRLLGDFETIKIANAMAKHIMQSLFYYYYFVVVKTRESFVHS